MYIFSTRCLNNINLVWACDCNHEIKLCLYICCICLYVEESNNSIGANKCSINPFQYVCQNQQHLSECQGLKKNSEKDKREKFLSNWMVVKQFLCFYIDVACFVRCLLIYFDSGLGLKRETFWTRHLKLYADCKNACNMSLVFHFV